VAKTALDISNLYKPHSKQMLFHSAPERVILYGGAIGGGKTIALVNEALQLSLDYPGNVGYLCRHELTSFRRSTLLEFTRYCPEELLEQHHQTENYFKFKNGSLIFYGGLGDDNAGLDRLKSMTLGWFGIDQAEETSETHFNMLLGRLRINLPNIHYKALLTCNPAPGWVKNLFIEQKKEGFRFIQSLPRDNPYLPSDYEEILRKQYPPELAKAWLDGDWDVLEGGAYLFRYADIRRAINRTVNIDASSVNKGADAVSSLITMGVDVAREGDDESVAVIRQGDKVLAIESWMKTDLMTTTGRILNLAEKYEVKDENINLDAVGLGAGVYDRLKELKHNINAIIAGGQANDKDHFTNTRAEMYSDLQKRFENDGISIPDDLDLIAQLSSIRYEIVSDRRMQIVPKEEMKRKFRVKSPDKADALALAFYYVRPKTLRIEWL